MRMLDRAQQMQRLGVVAAGQHVVAQLGGVVMTAGGVVRVRRGQHALGKSRR